MRLVLVRHAEAAPGAPDAERPLTSRGREQARELGERLAREGIRPETVLTSPLRRARETADLVGTALGVGPEPDARLAPGATAERVREAIAGRGELVLAVGHQPDCGRIAAAIRGGPEPPFPTAGVLVLDVAV
ncbi:MAG: histidine phosphatase family protein [Thermoleophilia bacterium]|nr:histidine phosphatase family protein [Thermoleophilia bacterium]